MERIRVMIVEDSSVVRQFLEHIISSDPRLEVAASLECAEEALQTLQRLSPDVISMDIHLPGIDGYEATKRIMEDKPTPIVVVSGSIESTELKSSMQALRAGALAVVEKPVGTSHRDYETLAERLCTQLAIMSQVKVIRQRFNRSRQQAHPPTRAGASGARPGKPHPAGPFTMLGIVASTGGPSALQTLLTSLGSDFALPIVVVQHITAGFHDGFVEWLDDACPLAVSTARHGERPQPGHVYVAPPDRHLKAGPRSLKVVPGQPVCAQRPSGTVLFDSMASSLGHRALGVLLTGMGEDGAEGLQRLWEAGGYTLAEHESTAVVFGMPSAAVRRGAVCQLLPAFELGPRISALLSAQSADGRHPQLVEEAS